MVKQHIAEMEARVKEIDVELAELNLLQKQLKEEYALKLEQSEQKIYETKRELWAITEALRRG